ncbi:MAG: histidine kinase [Actinomycetota bacterium]|nr:histidine kinase [Actinomycetota bacterium]
MTATAGQKGAMTMAVAARALTQGAVADDVRGPKPAVLWSIAVAGLAAAAAVFAITSGIDEQAPVVDASLVAWITLAYVLCGLIAWSRRPESRFGPLMVAAGFGPLLSRLSEVDASLPQTIGEVCRLLPVVLFLHVFLAYPSGRLERRAERVVVVTGYSSLVGFGLVAMMLGPSGRESVIEVISRPGAGDAVLASGRIAIVAVALAALGLLVGRARSSARPLRRSLVGACFGLALVAIAVGIVLKAFDWPAAEPIKWVAFALFALAPVLFLIGFLRSRLARSAAADLFIHLQTDPAPADLRDALARALRDPSLMLVYWLPEFASYANLDGGEVDLDELGVGRAVTLIDHEGSHVAAMLHEPALKDEAELLDAVTAAAAISLENGRLHAELRARLDELRGSRARIIDAGQKERQRLERNLHDGAQQRLIALSLELSVLEERLDDDPDARRRLDQARQEIATSLEELRDVARGIHPAVVSGHGLEIALQQLAARAPVPVRLNVEVQGRLPERLEVAAFYLVSESLANIGKHASATVATIRVARTSGQVVVDVIDDGVGGADTERGSGLRGLADRVEALEGRLRIWSPRGGGTRLRAEIPCVQ